jgi:hypothetical protein
MKAEDLVELLEERPFSPIRLHLFNGRTHEVRHPEMAVVSDEIVSIGLPPDDAYVLVEQVTHCATAHIVEAEPLPDRKQQIPSKGNE